MSFARAPEGLLDIMPEVTSLIVFFACDQAVPCRAAGRSPDLQQIVNVYVKDVDRRSLRRRGMERVLMTLSRVRATCRRFHLADWLPTFTDVCDTFIFAVLHFGLTANALSGVFTKIRPDAPESIKKRALLYAMHYMDDDTLAVMQHKDVLPPRHVASDCGISYLFSRILAPTHTIGLFRDNLKSLTLFNRALELGEDEFPAFYIKEISDTGRAADRVVRDQSYMYWIVKKVAARQAELVRAGRQPSVIFLAPPNKDTLWVNHNTVRRSSFVHLVDLDTITRDTGMTAECFDMCVIVDFLDCNPDPPILTNQALIKRFAAIDKHRRHYFLLHSDLEDEIDMDLADTDPSSLIGTSRCFEIRQSLAYSKRLGINGTQQQISRELLVLYNQDNPEERNSVS